jgi:hypothetical protein
LFSLQHYAPHPLLTLTHNAALAAYVRGDWSVARMLLEQVLAWKCDDGPAMTLLDFMRSHAFTPPHDWAGFRRLEKK